MRSTFMAPGRSIQCILMDDDAQGFLRPVVKSMKLSGGQYICQACLSGSSVLRHWLLALFSTATDGSK